VFEELLSSEALLVELENSFILSMSYEEDDAFYRSRLMVPLLKHDTEPYILEIVREIDIYFDDVTTKIDSQHLGKLKRTGTSNFLYELTHTPGREYQNIISVSSDELTPFFHRIADESDGIIHQYLNIFCKYILKPQISKRLPLNVYFDENTSLINFEIPFTDTTPVIHINAVLHNWENTEEFIEDVTQSLIANFIPSKNIGYWNASAKI